MVGGPQSWELRYSLAVLGKSGAGEVQQRRTGQALGSSVRREEEEEKEEEEGEAAVLLLLVDSLVEKDTIWLGRSGGFAGSDIRAVCLYPSFFDQRRATHPDQRASVADTHGRYGGRSLPACCPARARHDLHTAIGWWDALERVADGVDCAIAVSIVSCIDVVVHGRHSRKAIHDNYSQQRS